MCGNDSIRSYKGRSSILAALKKLVEEGFIVREGSGRNTFYVRADSK